MQILIEADGNVRCVYGEAINLFALGGLDIYRGSNVEPTESGSWQADLSPVGGPVLGPYRLRSQALQAEREWLEVNWLDPSKRTCKVLKAGQQL